MTATALASGSAAFAANPNTMGATVSDDTSWMLLAKYTYHQLRLYAGYENITFVNPGTPLTTGLDNIAGIPVLLANISQKTYVNPEHLQISWTGRDMPSLPLSTLASRTTTTIKTATARRSAPPPRHRPAPAN